MYRLMIHRGYLLYDKEPVQTLSYQRRTFVGSLTLTGKEVPAIALYMTCHVGKLNVTRTLHLSLCTHLKSTTFYTICVLPFNSLIWHVIHNLSINSGQCVVRDVYLTESSPQPSCYITHVVHHSDSDFILPVRCVSHFALFCLGGWSYRVGYEGQQWQAYIQWSPFMEISHALSTYWVLYHHYSHWYVFT